MEKLTLEQAIELSIKKWEYIIKNGGDCSGILSEIPEIAKLKHQCGLCQYTIEIGEISSEEKNCKICPLYKAYNNVACWESDSDYCKWGDALSDDNCNEALIAAKNLLEKIKSLKNGN